MSGHKPLVSVIMNCYNSETYLKTAIESIYAQSYVNWEIIFWDNNSTDHSAEIAQSFDDKLRYFKGNETIPLYAARNKALEKCRGEFVTFLDCDDLWVPNKLEKQLAFLHQHDYVMTYSSFEAIDHEGRHKYYFKVNNKSGDVFSYLMKRYNIAVLTVMVRKDFLDHCGFRFDDQAKYFGDFSFFCLTAARASVGVMPEILAQYRYHEQAATSQMDLNAHLEEYKSISRYLNQFLDEKKQKMIAKKITHMSDVLVMKKNILASDPRVSRKLARRYAFFDMRHFCFYLVTFLPVFFRRKLCAKYLR